MEPAAREMLAKDVESHASQLAGCEKSFREANLKCILEMDKLNKTELMATSSSEVGQNDNILIKVENVCPTI